MTAKRASTKKGGGKAVATTKTRAAAAAGPMGAGAEGDGLLTEGFIRVTISDEHFELRGTVGDHVKVAWHKPFEKGVDLGTALDMAEAVASALGVADPAQFKTELQTKLDAVKNLPIAKQIVAIVEQAHVRVTDLGIDTLAGKYQFGFGWNLSTLDPPAAYKGISLDAFGLLFTYTKPAGS